MSLAHALQLYEDERSLAGNVAEFIADGLAQGDGVLVIAGKPRWTAFVSRVPDAPDAIRTGQLRFFAARPLLETCADAPRFQQALGGILGLARLRFKTLRVFEEMSDQLWREDDREGAMRLERYWRSLHENAPFNLLCACPLNSLETGAYDGTLQKLCTIHTHLLPAQDSDAFDETVTRAVNEVLEPQLARMLHALAAVHRPAVQMPAGQAILLWLAEQMPRTAEKVLARARLLRPST